MARDDPHFRLRVPAALRDRIAAAAKSNNRSMNSEIVRVLEEAFPQPVTTEELIADIQDQVRVLKKFRGPAMLMVLADSIDFLLSNLAKSKTLTHEERKIAEDFVNERGKFTRFVPPSESD